MQTSTTKPTSKYEALDALLTMRIARVVRIRQPSGRQNNGGGQAFRLRRLLRRKDPDLANRERRLQALRKQGRIKFVKSVWCIKRTGRLL